MSAMLEIGDLHVSYGQVDAVRGVSLALMPGQIVSVIGPNGAGKTTLLGAVMGLLPSHGTLRFEGADLNSLDVEARSLQLNVPDEELERRRAEWTPPPERYERGYGALYNEQITQADTGCDFAFLARPGKVPDPYAG